MPVLETGSSRLSGHRSVPGSTRKRWRILQNRIERARDMRESQIQGERPSGAPGQDLAKIDLPPGRES